MRLHSVPGLILLIGALVAIGVLGAACASPEATTAGAIAPAAQATDTPAPATSTPVPTETPAPTATPTSTPTPEPTATPSPTATPTPVKAASVLEKDSLLTIYGRGWDIAPILGMLGGFKDADHMEREITERFIKPMDAINGPRGVKPTIHLIYAMAIPCEPDPTDVCLLYLDTAGEDIIKDYIEPAAKRGWHVILDTQHGRSDSMAQVKRMIDRGYLKYDNVHVALDPEFKVVEPGQKLPGIPIGTIPADHVNQVQKMLDEYVVANKLKTKKIVMVHQFGDKNVDDGVPFMIQDKETLKTFENVDLVIDADGFGHPDPKVTKYNRMVDPKVYPFIKWRAIKIFFPNPYEQAGHYDKPVMDFEELYGKKQTPGGYRIEHEPDIIVVA